MERTVVQCTKNDFVWAKVTGYSYWPGIVLEPNPLAPPRSQNNMKWVYFFGSHNYAWVRIKYIKPYSDYKNKYGKNCPPDVLEAKFELRRHKKRLAMDPDYQFNIVKFVPKERRARSKSVTSQKSRRSKSSRSVVNDDDDDNRGEEEWQMEITKSRVGVLAGNINAESIMKSLISTKHKLVIWSESEALCAIMKKRAADERTYCSVYRDPRDVVRSADITFSLLSSKAEVEKMLQKLGWKNDDDDLLSGKIYVEMTTIDYSTSTHNAAILKEKGAIYFEVMVEGTKSDIANRKSSVLIGGNLEEFECTIGRFKSCFGVLGRYSYFVGSSTKIYAIFQMMKAQFLASFSEIVALADKCVDLKMFFELFRESPLHNIYLERVCQNIQNNTYFDIQESIPGLQQDLERMLDICEIWKQPAPMTSIANQLYKHARRMGFDDRDSSAMFLRAK